MKQFKNRGIAIGVFILIVFLIPTMTVFFIPIEDKNAFAAGNTDLVVQVISSDLKGNMIEGDCIIITYGDMEILVDVGSENKDTFKKIQDSMSEVMQNDTEKRWDYIIFSHPDEDHIGNYEEVFSLFDDNWTIGNIIDFDIISNEGESVKYTSTANQYRAKRQKLIKQGVSYFSAAGLKPNNLTKTYDLGTDSSTTLDCKLTVLYNYYDDLNNVRLDSNGKISDKNLMSVCFLIQIGEQKLLFTGDLTRQGEERLLYYHKDLLKNVTFFKAGHHGSQGGKNSNSPASNTEEFIDWIKPAYVSITNMSGAAQPDGSINNFRKYTDCIYPSYVFWNDEYYKMFGNQKIIFDGKNVHIETEANNNNLNSSIVNAVITDNNGRYCWYNECIDDSSRDIKDSVYVYTFDDIIDGEIKGKAEYYNCTLIKYGNYDLLIDCGSSAQTSNSFVQKLREYVVDGKIDCLIVTHNKPYCLSQIAGNYTLTDIGRREIKLPGVVDSFEIGTIIDNEITNFDDTMKSSCLYRYRDVTKDLSNHISLDYGDYKEIKVNDTLVVKVYGSTFPKSGDEDENDYSMPVIVEFHGEKLLFVGDLTNYGNLLDKYREKIKNVSFLRLSNSVIPVKDLIRFEEFATVTNPTFITIGTPLYYSIEGLGKKVFDDHDQAELLRLFNKYDQNIYYLGYDVVAPNQHYYYRENGDLVFRMSYRLKRISTEMNKITTDNKWVSPSTMEQLYNFR